MGMTCTFIFWYNPHHRQTHEMRFFIVFLAMGCSLSAFTQTAPLKLPSSAMQIVVDSKDNLIVHCYRGRMVKIAANGTMIVITDDLQKGFKQNPYPKCEALAIDGMDNLYFTDRNVIWQMSPSGQINTFIGLPYLARRTDGSAAVASFRSIQYMKADPTGGIFVVERDDTNKDGQGDYYVIRKISADKMVSTITDTRNNPALKSTWIAGIGVDSVGNLYLSDGAARCVKKLEKNGTITTLAGICNKREFKPVYIQGDISKAELMSPEDIVLNRKGEIIFADLRLNRIIKIAGNKVTTLAGASEIQPNSLNMGGRSKEGYKDGKALTALFGFPPRVQIAIDSKDNLYIIDGGNDCIRKLSAAGLVTTVSKNP